MKKITALLIACSFMYSVDAQVDLKKKIVDSTCACLNEMPGLSEKSQEEIQMAVGQCMMQKSMTDFMALAQERSIDFTDQDEMQKLGLEIGMDLVKADCKAMNAMMLKMAGKSNKNAEAKKLTSVKGTVQNVVTAELVYVTVLSGSKSEKLVWSDYVSGGDKYVGNLAALKNKSLEFSYVSKEIYSPKLKSYVTIKMIESVK